ncbi:ATP-grasp fold amidoligase family protein [Anaerococcus tetradius]|uniref:ATP-grasp fold amidoligase family protein n=1 Tax=Anaerococcus tetradius TaxID=33036 RepID=UPI0023F05B54|nr:ATP-grasp fold amidoligase family protein [Anaerococcus tetradius]
MMCLRKIFKYISNIEYRIRVNSKLGFYDNLEDIEFIKLLFKASMGYKLPLENPKTFNEKLQWLKLYDRKPEYTIMVDKYKVRDYISKKIGGDYLIPLIDVWDDPDEIDFNLLPNQFVLKCNHNSGGVFICKNKNNFDIVKVKKELKKELKRDYYLSGREWPYKDVPRKIICEKYMVDESGYELKDYKIFCFNGEPKFIQMDYDRFSNHRRKFYDSNWNQIDFKFIYDSDNTNFQIPKNLNKMLELSRILSRDVTFLRTDFYIIKNKIYFGELTFYPESGFGKFTPKNWDGLLGDLINLPTDLS